MSASEAYAFTALAFVLGGLVGSGLACGWALKKVRAIQSDIDDRIRADVYKSNPKE